LDSRVELVVASGCLGANRTEAV